MFEFKWKKVSRSGLGRHLMALDPFVSDPWQLKQHTILRSIHTSVVTWHHQLCALKHNTNDSMLIHLVLLRNPQATHKSVEGHRMLTPNLHLMSLLSCEFVQTV